MKLKKRLRFWVVLLLPRKLIKGGATLLLALILLFTFLMWPCRYLTVFQTTTLKEATVIIDPGHGGIDGGVSRGEMLEKEITLKIAKLLKTMLERKGCSVLMTRETDTDLSHLLPNGSDSRHRRDVHGRAKFINESGGDLFVSIHIDACIEDPYTRGAIVFYGSSNDEGRAFATIIQNHFNKITSTNLQAGEYVHQNIKEGNFYLLNNITIPGVIAEVGFITNASDKKLLATHSYRKKLAEAICNGVVDYLRRPPSR
jgi:N-acetylmuramoyl-L-alanine amidase